ncbi:MAG: hypothetical protein JO170_06585 [Verrucomicrobia bacterium]|nr:hypothetical protein [Verrucomicrobiota bacterium]
MQKELAKTINDAPIAPVFVTDQTSIPLRVYLPSISLMIAAVGSIIAAWCLLAIFFYFAIKNP